MYLPETCYRTEFQDFASIFCPQNGIPIFLLCGTVWSGILRVSCFGEWSRTVFREFASIFVSQYRILSILLLCRTVRNGILRVFCSAEQPGFRRNKPIVPPIPSSAESFLCCKLPTLMTCDSITTHDRSWPCGSTPASSPRK
jgi:hypothetical protein